MSESGGPVTRNHGRRLEQLERWDEPGYNVFRQTCRAATAPPALRQTARVASTTTVVLTTQATIVEEANANALRVTTFSVHQISMIRGPPPRTKRLRPEHEQQVASDTTAALRHEKTSGQLAKRHSAQTISALKGPPNRFSKEAKLKTDRLSLCMESANVLGLVAKQQKLPRQKLILAGNNHLKMLSLVNPENMREMTKNLAEFESGFPHSKSFQEQMGRLLPILNGPPTAWPANLRILAEVSEWAATTTMTAWRAMMTAATILGLPITPREKLVTKMLQRKVHVHHTRQPAAMTKEHAQKLARLKASEHIQLPLLIAWCLAQRPSDLCRLAPEDVVAEHGFVSITIRRGK